MNTVISAVGGWFPFVLLTFAAGGCLLAAAVALTGRHIPDVDDASEAARGFNCPLCDGRQPEADCECAGDCGRRGCPWLLLDVLNGPDDAFNAAIARLHADLNAGGDQ
jgi:hypothetical protein